MHGYVVLKVNNSREKEIANFQVFKAELQIQLSQGGQMSVSDNELKELNLCGLAKEFYMGGIGKFYETDNNIDLFQNYNFTPEKFENRNLDER